LKEPTWTDNIEEMKQKILAIRVEKLECLMRTFISRRQAGSRFGWWVSTKTSLCMRGHFQHDLFRPRRHRKEVTDIRSVRCRRTKRRRTPAIATQP
jgi:hypothetical protein